MSERPPLLAMDDERSPASVGDRSDGSERGVLRVADKVVDKVARAAVLGVAGVAPDVATTGTVGRALGRAYPHITCSRAGDRARVQLEIALVWPAPAAMVARQVCEAVTEQLRTLTGVHVDEVRATVARIVDPSDVLGATGTTKERRVR
ncbi:Asp23/Gls24 family envelope stress response protein [Oerskovia sp. NPDC057915]|uniref:Asp23/Gls24 family envelope stress response protein n=1 Tax=Oerskovia sp. NPDC057915 TaxID=3346280 RepID=UPI0036DBC5C3